MGPPSKHHFKPLGYLFVLIKNFFSVDIYQFSPQLDFAPPKIFHVRFSRPLASTSPRSTAVQLHSGRNG